ncbi:pH-response regulator protein palA/rim20, partial [Kappamyces sp. JEL0680]
MLKVPFKSAESLRYTFETLLSASLQEVFEEDPQTYLDDFSTLETLRLSIQDPQVHEQSAATHLSYYAQLHYLESKFDISEDGLKGFWTWANAFGNREYVTSNTLGFEKASVLFNLAAIYSHLAVNLGVGSEDAMKKSALYFQQSAGAFQTITDKLPVWGIEGNANTQLNALCNLMLAQAQEVFLAKAISSKMKEGTLAKLAMQVSTFYGVAHDIASETSIFDKSLDAESGGKYGEQVAWLTAAAASIKAAQDKQLVKHFPNAALETEIKTYATMVDLALRKATSDNDRIYMETVPKDLPPLPPARMVNPVLVPEIAAIPVQRPVFRNLVPFKVHEAASKYAYKKDVLIKNLCSKMSDATALAQS